VVPTLSAELSTRMQHVLACRISLAEHQTADPSVPSTRNVAPTSRANAINASTPVPALVALSPLVGLLTTNPFVLAPPVTLVTPSVGAHLLQVRTLDPEFTLFFHSAPFLLLLSEPLIP